MKKLIFLIALLVVLPSATYAEDGKTREKPPRPLAPPITRQASTTREDMRDKAEDAHEKGRENAVQRIKAHLIAYHSILEAAINRMEKLAERIESRIKKMKANGKDTSDAEAFVTTAHTELDAAASDLAQIKTNAEAVTVSASTTPATAFGPTHELMKSAREHIGNAWKALKDAVRSLKDRTDDSPSDNS